MGRTNLDIINKDSWNWIKNEKNFYEFKSVADYIFRMFNFHRRLDIDEQIFLMNIEKFFEYEHYDMDEFSKDMDLKMNNIMKLVDKYLGIKIPILNLEDKELKKKINKKIHDLMIKKRILPLELLIAYNLKSFIDTNQIDMSKYRNLEDKKTIDINLNNEKILSILFPNDKERMKEVYCETSNYAEKLVNSGISDDFKCIKCDTNCLMKKPDYIYHKSGINITFDDLEDDFISEILREKYRADYLVCYGFCLTVAITSLIKKNLLRVRSFIENEIYTFENRVEIAIFIDILIEISDKEAKSLTDDETFEAMYDKFIEVPVMS